MQQSSSQESPTTAVSPSKAMNSNATVFKQMSTSMKTLQYPATVDKLARWLNDGRAYYDAARGPIVQLLQLAHDQLRIVLGVTPLNAQLYTHPWVPSYVNLIQIVSKYVRHFKEPDLQEKVLRLVNTIPGTVHAPPRQKEIIDVDAEEIATTSGLATNAQSAEVKHNLGLVISTASSPSRLVSSMSKTLVSATASQSTPSSKDIQSEEKPNDNYPASLATESSGTPNEPSLETAPGIEVKVEGKLVKSYTGTDPVLSILEPKPPAIDRRDFSHSPLRSDVGIHLLVEPAVEPLLLEQNFPVSSEVHSSLVTALDEGNFLTPTPHPELAGVIVLKDTRMDVDDSTAQTDKIIDVTPNEKTPNNPRNDRDVIMNDVQCDTNDEMEVDARPPSTEIVLSERIVVTEGISESATSQSGGEGLGYASTAQEVPRHNVPQEKDAALARTPILCQPIVSVSSINPGTKASAEKAIFTTHSRSKEGTPSSIFTPLRALSQSAPATESLSKMPQIYLPAIDGFSSTMKVIAFHASPAYGNVDFAIQLTDDQMQSIMTWNRRHQLESLQGPIHKSICLSLACYSAKDIPRIMQLASEGEVAKIGYQFFNRIRSTFPTNDVLRMDITRGGKTQKIPLSPPLSAFLTPDGHIDLGMHIKWTFNKIRLRRSRRGVEGDFVFVLHAHSPTRAQLQQLEKKVKDTVSWNDWLAHLSRPFDLSSNPFVRQP